jgi:hypothetical protein
MPGLPRVRGSSRDLAAYVDQAPSCLPERVSPRLCLSVWGRNVCCAAVLCRCPSVYLSVSLFHCRMKGSVNQFE